MSGVSELFTSTSSRAAAGADVPRRPRRSRALLLVALAVAWSAAPARALEPDLLPDMLWWRGAAAPSVFERPLEAASRDPAFRTGAEWAPLFRGADGTRIERATRGLRAWTTAGRWRAGVDLDVRDGEVIGGGTRRGFGTHRPGATLGTLALATGDVRLGLAGAVTLRDQVLGAALEATAPAGPAVASVAWSRTPHAARADVRWEGDLVATAGMWIDQRARVALAAPCGPAQIALTQEAIGRRALGDAAEGPGLDALVPTLAWRASTLEAAGTSAAVAWRAGVAYGEGREGLRVARGGAPYASLGGKRFVALATLALERGVWNVRAWHGRVAGDARGSLALWPFDALATLAGTRRLGAADGALVHHGVTLDRRPDAAGWDAGLAAWRLLPRGRYTSWRASLAGLGRDDVATGGATITSALLCGARLGGTLVSRWGRVRAEVVQWAPVYVARTRVASSGEPDGGGPGAGRAGGPDRPDRGGTIVRLSIESGD